jgi:hypothetical protein
MIAVAASEVICAHPITCVRDTGTCARRKLAHRHLVCCDDTGGHHHVSIEAKLIARVKFKFDHCRFDVITWHGFKLAQNVVQCNHAFHGSEHFVQKLKYSKQQTIQN